MFDLTGKTALVTGASGGIGGAIAKALHAQGAKVVLSGTRLDALEAVKAELGANAFVAGSAVFKGGTMESYKTNISAIRNAAALARGDVA